MQASVVIPVGPYPANKRWLKECIDSTRGLTDDVVLVDDGAAFDKGLPPVIVYPTYIMERYVRYIRMPWRTGISHAFNYGVMLARNECVFMLGSDDTLEPTCIEKCLASYEKRKQAGQADGYYSVPIRYMDTGEVQTAPCNAAMVTKGFWRKSGGFPIESAIGIGDSILLSICLKHNLPVYWVGEDVGQPDIPLYNYRRHPEAHTYKIPWGIADPLRNYLTEIWNPEEIEQWSGNY